MIDVEIRKLVEQKRELDKQITTLRKRRAEEQANRLWKIESVPAGRLGDLISLSVRVRGAVAYRPTGQKLYKTKESYKWSKIVCERTKEDCIKRIDEVIEALKEAKKAFKED